MNHDVSESYFDDFLTKFKDYSDTYESLYCLNAVTNDEIDQIYQNFKLIMIQKYKIPPRYLLVNISHMARYRNRNLKIYWEIFWKIYEEYHPKLSDKISEIFAYFLYKNHSIWCRKIAHLTGKHQYFILDVHEKGTILRAIMFDDITSFLVCVDRNDFNLENLPINPLYPPGCNSLLKLCCYHGAVKCFKLLISKFNIKIDKDCLNLSFLGGNPEILNECLKTQKPDLTCMKYALKSHNIHFVTYLMNEFKIELTIDDCCLNNNLQALFILLDQTKDINNIFFSSLFFHSPVLIEYFISKGVNVNMKRIDRNNIFHLAVKENLPEILGPLITFGIDPYYKGEHDNTAIHLAAELNSIEIGEALFSLGVDINTKKRNGDTALHIAAKYNFIEFAKFLLNYGADINSKNERLNTPLHTATLNNNREFAEFLLSQGADINLKNLSGETPLHTSSWWRRNKVMDVLLRFNVDVNARDNHGRTPLHCASFNNSLENVILMLKHGADPNLKDDVGNTAYDIAVYREWNELAEILKDGQMIIDLPPKRDFINIVLGIYHLIFEEN